MWCVFASLWPISFIIGYIVNLFICLYTISDYVEAFHFLHFWRTVNPNVLFVVSQFNVQILLDLFASALI